MQDKKLLKTFLVLLASFGLLSYNEDPPNGRTGAPFDGKCSDCHIANNPGGFNGTAEIIGLPDTIQPNTSYLLQLKATVTAGHPVRGGFQLVVVDKNNQNVGDLSIVNGDSDTEFMGGREYLDQRLGKFFNNGPVTWSFRWASPAEVDCNTVKFYYIVNFCNGSGDFGDHSIPFADSVYFAGGLLDSTPPQIICPTSLSVCSGDTVHYDLPILSDNCALADTLPLLISGLSNDTIFPLGSTEMVFQASDASGNIAFCSFQVDVDSCPVGTIHSLEHSQTLLIVPNPVHENSFFVHGLEKVPLALALINLQGQVVATFPVSAWPGPFFIAAIPDAVYGLRVFYEDAYLNLLLFVQSK